MSVLQRERDLYEKVWTLDQYGVMSPGEEFAEAFFQMVGGELYGTDTMLDAGCGAGKGALALSKRGLQPFLVDLVDVRCEEAKRFAFKRTSLWTLDVPLQDWGYCCDVMEHLPKEYTMLAASRILNAVKHGAFFSIALVPDNMGVFVGEPLHKTVEPFTWWRDRLAELGRIIECRDLLSNGLYLVEAM